ncbi:MAG: adenylyltransferase/cytidyltransferase family protein [Puniceicoccales bacterium]|jgi:D-beta-D-heptose 7-phosphate kinase/D-beta-D-heptose 1-phosphate adenosyltransferase|nr:adenylyltransferase/cytidyltransferase family protein [Puniceicoccales bacterium]
MLANPKLFSLEEATKIRNQHRNRTIVLTNGCFDLLHAGHVFSLQQAASFGELWIALNGDESIHQLKGPLRPIIGEWERAYVLAALECVSGIFIFPNQRLTRELEIFHPDIYVKSTDYNLQTLHGEERLVLEKIGATVKFVQTLPNLSTTILINRIQNATS